MFARKEVFEILRTWRIYVLPALMLFFAVTGPPLARFTPELLTVLAGSQLGALQLPEPTVFDAYGQWAQNLSQVALFALIIIYGGIVSSERRSGTAILVLTKPVSRAAFVVVKVLVHSVFLAVILVLGTMLTWGTSAIFFGEAPAGPLWSAAMTWLVLGVVYLSLMTLFSVLIPSGAGASGAGLGAFLLLSVAGLWAPLSDYSPAGLLGQAAGQAAGNGGGPTFWQIGVSLASCVGAVWLAAAMFKRQEL